MVAARVGVALACVVALGVLGVVRVAGAPAQQGTRDWTPILKNKGLVDPQMRCLQGSGPCDRIGDHLTRAATEVLGRNCANCTPEQQANANRLLNFIRSNYPAEYGQIYNRFRG